MNGNIFKNPTLAPEVSSSETLAPTLDPHVQTQLLQLLPDLEMGKFRQPVDWV